MYKGARRISKKNKKEEEKQEEEEREEEREQERRRRHFYYWHGRLPDRPCNLLPDVHFGAVILVKHMTTINGHQF
jgi:hypothetical protein